MNVGLVLSGGGARGFAHLGVIKGLQENGFKIQAISGVSAGAVAGALIAAGYKPDKILEIFISTKLYRFLRPSIKLMGLLKMERVEKLYDLYLPDSFEKLQIPLTVCTADIQNGKTVFFDKGPLIKPIMASCCIPIVFEPLQINGKMYIDGGILNNLPVEPLLGKCDFIIGVHTNPINLQMQLTSMRAVMERSLLLAIQSNIKERIGKCNLLIEPPTLNRFTTFDSKKAREIFEIGYAFTMGITDHLLEIREKNLI
ncbi:patatin-like phospholipase family protein [Rhodocytophaga rosea]|uniref:Patatin-like phospholipase family protein n=1 Tax=Rhodocytophaga rosea TaxID=2704465 RepID=A0A6C0GGZ0_9BACT|nr:patatin-like phospholipase family protein [Rhodocytophaga rosea]QHT67094.1 patatin-like phospholipase family protein [Rhodocytophaga rosea]